MRRSLAALVGGMVLATLGGCGGGGGGETPQANKPAESQPTASIPGPNQPAQAASPMPSPTPPEGVLPGEILPPIEEVDETKNLIKARQQVDILTTAVANYIAKHKAAPKSLEALAQPVGTTPAYIDPGLLVDPWGAAFQYDARGNRNKNKQPDIWSLGPPAGTIFVGNWSDKPTPAQ